MWKLEYEFWQLQGWYIFFTCLSSSTASLQFGVKRSKETEQQYKYKSKGSSSSITRAKFNGGGEGKVLLIFNAVSRESNECQLRVSCKWKSHAELRERESKREREGMRTSATTRRMREEKRGWRRRKREDWGLMAIAQVSHVSTFTLLVLALTSLIWLSRQQEQTHIHSHGPNDATAFNGQCNMTQTHPHSHPHPHPHPHPHVQIQTQRQNSPSVLDHRTEGGGNPSAWQSISPVFPFRTEVSWGSIIHLGGTAGQKAERRDKTSLTTRGDREHKKVI